MAVIIKDNEWTDKGGYVHSVNPADGCPNMTEHMNQAYRFNDLSDAHEFIERTYTDSNGLQFQHVNNYYMVYGDTMELPDHGIVGVWMIKNIGEVIAVKADDDRRIMWRIVNDEAVQMVEVQSDNEYAREFGIHADLDRMVDIAVHMWGLDRYPFVKEGSLLPSEAVGNVREIRIRYDEYGIVSVEYDSLSEDALKRVLQLAIDTTH